MPEPVEPLAPDPAVRTAQPAGVTMVALYGLHPINMTIMSPAAELAGSAGATDVVPAAHAPAVRTPIATRQPSLVPNEPEIENLPRAYWAENPHAVASPKRDNDAFIAEGEDQS
jgi:hypothetical protein